MQALLLTDGRRGCTRQLIWVKVLVAEDLRFGVPDTVWRPTRLSHVSLNTLVWGHSYLGHCQEILYICPHLDGF